MINDPLYNHEVFGPVKGKGGDIGGKTDEQLVKDLINIHNAENWLGIDGDSDLSLFKPLNPEDGMSTGGRKGNYPDYKSIMENLRHLSTMFHRNSDLFELNWALTLASSTPPQVPMGAL